ncbi:hypothetical protein KY312_00405 [Candidatus Woesearchaeota archaeon]|nr:hypothetical protein [Candidatus Woesearchaeota archaeon]
MDKQAGYFQGILQLRNVDDSIVQYVLNQFEKNKISIGKIEEVKNGLDIYSSSNKFSRKLAHKLQNEFGGEIKESPKLYSKSKLTSRNIYRLNVLYLAPSIRKGEIVKVNDKIIKVSSLTKNIIRGTELVKNRRVSILNKSAKILKPKKAMIVKLKPQIEVMHPETYQAVIPENKKNVKINEEVAVVIYKNKLYLI